MLFAGVEGEAWLPRRDRQRGKPGATFDGLARPRPQAMGDPIDGKGPRRKAVAHAVPQRAASGASRKRVGAPLDLGVREPNTFLTCCRGQRMGIFAGSGVGNGVLSMLARNVDADVTVIGLAANAAARSGTPAGRLGDEGLARSVVVVATSDEPH